MCGIVGKYSLKGEPVLHNLIKGMCDKITYRGPDDSGVYVTNHVGLGHRRLSIIDLSQNGHQPMNSEDGQLWITYNGEVYNFKDLRKDLVEQGHAFRSDSDTEVILHLYQVYREKCLEYLRGMFAFAIYDQVRNTLFLARDRIGKKPLFYYFDGKSFIFASEIKSILVDETVKREIDYTALNDYFKYLYIPAPKTIYKNIYKLEPGHTLEVSKKGIRKKQYWDISFKSHSWANEDELAEELLQTLKESVHLRMISDVPLGAFLSGGIDSSSVVALMAQRNGKPVTTCSIGFTSKDYDEIHYARSIARKFHTDHHEYTVQQDIASILPRLAYHFDEPFADSSAIPTYYVSQIARKQVTVALAGDGGDENFAGYEKYSIDNIENQLRQKFPHWLRKKLFPRMSRWLANGHQPLFQKGKTLLGTLSHESDYGFYLTNTEFEKCLWDSVINAETKAQIGDYDPFHITEHFYHKANTDDHLSKILYTDLKTYLPGDILMKVDRMSMAHSLEVRAPILDHKVIELAAGIPADLKFRKGEKKYILKKTFEPILPQDILYRKKMGFSTPMADWFRGELNGYAATVLFEPKAGLKQFFKPQVIESIWQQHQSGARNHATVLWSLLMFELWFQEYMR